MAITATAPAVERSLTLAARSQKTKSGVLSEYWDAHTMIQTQPLQAVLIFEEEGCARHPVHGLGEPFAAHVITLDHYESRAGGAV